MTNATGHHIPALCCRCECPECERIKHAPDLDELVDAYRSARDDYSEACAVEGSQFVSKEWEVAIDARDGAAVALAEALVRDAS